MAKSGDEAASEDMATNYRMMVGVKCKDERQQTIELCSSLARRRQDATGFMSLFGKNDGPSRLCHVKHTAWRSRLALSRHIVPLPRDMISSKNIHLAPLHDPSTSTLGMRRMTADFYDAPRYPDCAIVPRGQASSLIGLVDPRAYQRF